MSPTAAAAMAMPMIAPVGRPFEEPPATGADEDVDVDVLVPVAPAVTVDVKIGGKGRVGGILILEHFVKSDDRQQNDVALGEVRPQYVHNCTKFVPYPQLSGSFSRPCIQEELQIRQCDKNYTSVNWPGERTQ